MNEMGQEPPLELQGTENWRSQEGAGDRLSPSVNPGGGSPLDAVWWPDDTAKQIQGKVRNLPTRQRSRFGSYGSDDALRRVPCCAWHHDRGGQPRMPDLETVHIRAPYDAQAVYRGETRQFSVDETFELTIVA